MKEMLKLKDISYEIMDVSLFEGVNSSVLQGEVIGIIGKMEPENPLCCS